MILEEKHDPMGHAIRDYDERRPLQTLIVSSSMFDDDEMPIHHYFRTETEMNQLERMALKMCRGKVLDVGAGAGCHTLVLQGRHHLDVTAIDVSPLAVETMKNRGIRKCFNADFFSAQCLETYDTVLMLMNGIGIVGKLERLEDFFKRLDELLTPEGFLLADSSDLCYLFEGEDFDVSELDAYYGEVDFCMHYGKVHGKPFDWLYVDFNTLKHHAALSGFKAELIMQGENYHYLFKISRG